MEQKPYDLPPEELADTQPVSAPARSAWTTAIDMGLPAGPVTSSTKDQIQGYLST